MQLDVCGLGNALMDVLIALENDQPLDDLGLRKGIMHLVDEEAWGRAYSQVKTLHTDVYPGGSCANTISTLALLGANTLFCGQVADDEFGGRYKDALQGICGDHRLLTVPPGELGTGKCLSLISPDGERTMLTSLGLCSDLGETQSFEDAIAHAKVFHVTGYPFTGGRMIETAKAALEIAKSHGVKISFDVADPFVVRFHRDITWEIIDRYADIVFTNEEEAKALCELEPSEALDELAERCDVAVVKLGGKGSLIKQGDRRVHIGVHKVDVVDTTGAGDAYSAGLLYGLVRGWDLARAGKLASRVAAETVAQTGAVVHKEGLLRKIASAL